MENDQAASTQSSMNLSEIRDRALSRLVPLLDNLNEPPERKFDLCLSALRATDKSELLGKALSFAEQIEDNAAKAQALIDVANEATVRLETNEQPASA